MAFGAVLLSILKEGKYFKHNYFFRIDDPGIPADTNQEHNIQNMDTDDNEALYPYVSLEEEREEGSTNIMVTRNIVSYNLSQISIQRVKCVSYNIVRITVRKVTEFTIIIILFVNTY